MLFTLARTEDGAARWDNARIVIQSLTSNERSIVLKRANSGRYLATGHLVYARGGVVFAVPFDVQRKQVIGQGTAVIDGVRRAPVSATAGAQFAISNNGHLFYIPGPAGTGVTDRSIAIADRVGRVRRLPIPPGAYVHTRVSRDGKWLAVGTDDGKDAAVWTYTIGGNGVLQKPPSTVITGIQSGRRTERDWRSNPIAAAILDLRCNGRMGQAELND